MFVATGTTLKRLRRKRILAVEAEMEEDCPSPKFTPPPQTPTCKAAGIFGSPPEPLFNLPANNIPGLLQQSLQSLAQLNIEAISSYKEDKCEGTFRSGKSLDYFIHLSCYFNLPPDIKYRALELFHKFMTKHVCELYEHVQSSQQTSSPINWETVESRLKHQVILRALSCLQLASKLSLHYKIISINRIRSYLTNCGFRYASSSLVQSEIRILKTLDYRVHDPTPLDFIEVLLEALGHNDSSFPIKQLYGVSTQVLDIYYLSCTDIVNKLRKRALQWEMEPSKLTGIEMDYLLLASGIIGAGSFILDQSKSDVVIKCLSDVSCIVVDDILDLSAILIQSVMTDTM